MHVQISMHSIKKIEIKNFERGETKWQSLIATDADGESTEVVFFSENNDYLLPETLPAFLQEQAA